MKKLDIMNKRDEVGVGEVCSWQLVDGKPTKMEPKPEVKEEIRVVGPVVTETIEVVKEVAIEKQDKSEPERPTPKKAKKEVKSKWRK